jgi:hypothetical protein
MGITTQEITEFAGSVNWDRMHEALVARANSGDPRSMLALSKNDAEAQVAIEAWLGSPLTPVNMGAIMSTARQAMSLNHMHVYAEKDFRSGEHTGNIRVYGYLKNLLKRGQLMPSFELSLDKESARALAEALLAQLGE